MTDHFAHTKFSRQTTRSLATATAAVAVLTAGLPPLVRRLQGLAGITSSWISKWTVKSGLQWLTSSDCIYVRYVPDNIFKCQYFENTGKLRLLIICDEIYIFNSEQWFAMVGNCVLYLPYAQSSVFLVPREPDIPYGIDWLMWSHSGTVTVYECCNRSA